jgi:hypothetical protein
MTASIRTVPQLSTSAEIQLEDLSRGQRAAPHSKAKSTIFGHTPGGAITGPCLTDAAPEAAPGELFVGEPLRGGPNINYLPAPTESPPLQVNRFDVHREI